MSSLIAALLLLILLVRFWPPTGPPKPLDIVYDSATNIKIEEILPTSQKRQTPPPPAPLPPIIVPDDIILEEELVLDTEPLSTTDADLDSAPPELEASASSSQIQPTSTAKLIHIITPEYPRAARRRNIHAEAGYSFSSRLERARAISTHN